MLDNELSFDAGTPARVAADLVAALVQRSANSLELLLNTHVHWSGPDGERSCQTRNEALDAYVRLLATGGMIDVYETTIVGDRIRLRTVIRSSHPRRTSLAIYDMVVDQEQIVSVTHVSDEQSRPAPLIELLYFDGCPTHEPFLSHLLQLLHDQGFAPDVHLVNVNTEVEAAHHHFLGSPSLRINGHDVDPNAHRRNLFAVQCRLYPTPGGLAKTPPDAWITAALTSPPPKSGGC